MVERECPGSGSQALEISSSGLSENLTRLDPAIVEAKARLERARSWSDAAASARDKEKADSEVRQSSSLLSSLEREWKRAGESLETWKPEKLGGPKGEEFTPRIPTPEEREKTERERIARERRAEHERLKVAVAFAKSSALEAARSAEFTAARAKLSSNHAEVARLDREKVTEASEALKKAERELSAFEATKPPRKPAVPKGQARPTIAATDSLAEKVFGAHLRQLKRHVEAKGIKGLDAIYRDARLELLDRLRKFETSDRRVEPSSLRAMLAQVDAVATLMGDGLEKHLADVTRTAVELGARHGVDEFSTLERHFTGTTPVLQLESSAVFNGLVEGVDRSLVRRRSARAKTWSLDQAEQIERRMSVGVATGKPLFDLVADVQKDLATERWKAERIVRTESALAHSSAKQEVISTVEKDLGRPMQKKLIETIDDRTGDDSFLIHGQTVDADKPFAWMRKRSGGWVREEYMTPPNRPLDRSTMIAWDPEWDEDELTRPLSIAELRGARPTRWRKKIGVDIPPSHRPGLPPK